MTAKVKSVMSVFSEAVETAAGYALVAVGLYAVVFVDITGGGSLWKTLHNVQDLQDQMESPNAVRVIKVPTQAKEEKVHEERMLAVFDEPNRSGEVSAVYRAPNIVGDERPSAALIDTPADPKSGKTWKRGLKGSLRNFTVYGKGEQTSSASSSGSSGSRATVQAVSQPAVASLEGSPASIGASAAATRPGVGSHLSHGALSASDSSRNVR